MCVTGTFEENRSRVEIINRHRSVANVWKGIRGGICHALHKDGKANNKYMKEYDPSTGSLYLCTRMPKIYMDRQYDKGCM